MNPVQNLPALSLDIIYKIIRSSGLSDYDIAVLRAVCHLWKNISDIPDSSALPLPAVTLNPFPISPSIPKLKIFGENSWLKHFKLPLKRTVPRPENIIQSIRALQSFSKKENKDHVWLLILIPRVSESWISSSFLLFLESNHQYKNFKMPDLGFAKLEETEEPYWLLMNVNDQEDRMDYLFRNTEWQYQKPTVLEALIAFLMNQADSSSATIEQSDDPSIIDPFEFTGPCETIQEIKKLTINDSDNDSEKVEDFSKFKKALCFLRWNIGTKTSLQLTSQEKKAIKTALHGIEIANLELRIFSREQLTQLFLQAIERDISIKVNKTSYFIEYEKKQHNFNVLSSEKVIREGESTQVLQVRNCFDNNIEVLKTLVFCHKTVRELANTSFLNEFDLLTYIHSNGACWGIQLPPRKVLQMQERPKVYAYGLLGMLYDINYLQYIESHPEKNNFEDYLYEFHQLLSSLKTLHQKNILHGDIKPENILLVLEGNSIKLCHLADFGGAIRVEDGIPTHRLIGGGEGRGYTREYSIEKDIKLAHTLIRQRDLLVSLEEKRDVFSLGTTLYFALQMEHPYAFIGYYRHDLSAGFKPITRVAIPVEMDTLIKDMVSPSYENRPNASQAFERYNTLLQRSYPLVYAKIMDKVKTEYPGTIYS